MDELQTTREIDKTPIVPHLSFRAIKLLTELCFPTTSPIIEPLDAVLVFGSHTAHKALAAPVHDLLKHNLCQQVIATGGVPPYDDHPGEHPQSEAELFLHELSPLDYPEVALLQEHESHNTLENVIHGLAHPRLKTPINHLAYVCKSFASGRCYLTLKQHAPDATLYPLPVDVTYDDTHPAITRDNWYESDPGRTRVWGEYLRIQTYSKRGDIASSPFLEQLKDEI